MSKLREVSEDGKLLCSRCNEFKSPEEFYVRNRTACGRVSECKSCEADRTFVAREVVNGKIQCNKCGEWKDPELFPLGTRQNPIRKLTCNTCSYKPKKPVVVDGKKKCNGCGEWLDVSLFCKKTASKNGFTPRCKKCSVIYVNERSSRDPETYMSELAKTNSANRKNAKGRRASKISGESCVTAKYLHDLWISQGGMCAITGRKMTHVRGSGEVRTNASVDRIDSSKGYVDGNVQLVCIMANQMKRDMSDDDFYVWCKDVCEGYEHRKLSTNFIRIADRSICNV